MSLLLYNIAMDPPIQTLEDTGYGLGKDGHRMTTLTFADNLVLLSSSTTRVGMNLEIMETFCQLSGLRVQPRKCHKFFLDRDIMKDCQPWLIS